MSARRRILAAVGIGAVLLVVGRAFAFLYTEHVWYRALGAGDVWRERVISTALIHAATFVAATAFAFANFSAVRHSILSLVLPRRLANVEFGEAVPPRRLDVVALVIALVVALLAGSAVPDWSKVALVRTGLRFGEIDPYHQLDLSYYTAWLPLELQMHAWAWVVVLSVTLVVIVLYALTPGLRWENGAVRMTGYVRRHLAVLVGVVLVMLAWRARLRTFTLLYDGTGPDGAFSLVDHSWLLPSNVILSIASMAAAALFVWAVWSRQTTVAAVTVAAVALLWIAVHQAIPIVAGTPPRNTGQASAGEVPYEETRDAFTRRAFDGTEAGAGERSRAIAALTRSPRVESAARLAHVAPGVRGYLIVADSQRTIAAPSLLPFSSRVAHAWREQDARILGRGVPPHAKILRLRDVSRRIERLTPIFAQASGHGALFRADTLFWITDLYAASNTYPLSRRQIIDGERRGYFRHAGIAFTNSMTGAVTIVADAAPDAITRAWQRKFPATMRVARTAPRWTRELTLEPARLPPAVVGGTDQVFRARVRDLYLRMRAALSMSDLAAFGAALDSLGAALGSPPR